ncbi:conserved phage C-terminal domain-containing protein [Pontibacter mucosus]|nr:conserved phage C-terminal domain-containing protein [Pontibacter mucosus]
MHESDRRGRLLLAGKPISEERLANILHIDKQKISTMISTFLELGVASLCEETGALMNRRMVRDEELISKRREAGKKGGNPDFKKGESNPYYNKDKQDDNQEDNPVSNQEDKQGDNQEDKQTDKQKITPSSSSSASTNKDKYQAKACETWFIKKFNEITGKEHRVLPKKVKAALKARITEDGYTSAMFIQAIQNCMADEYHRETGLKHLTPEFITRADKLEKYLHQGSGQSMSIKPKTISSVEEQLDYFGGV